VIRCWPVPGEGSGPQYVEAVTLAVGNGSLGFSERCRKYFFAIVLHLPDEATGPVTNRWPGLCFESSLRARREFIVIVVLIGGHWFLASLFPDTRVFG